MKPSQTTTTRNHKRPPKLRNLLLCTIGATTMLSQAEPTPTIRYTQPAFPIGEPFLASHKGNNHSNQIFENVTLSEDEWVTEFRWEGVYTDARDRAANPSAPNTMSWELSIWSDENGRPGQRLFFEKKASDEISVESLAQTLYRGLKIPRYAFRFALTEPFKASAGTTYWYSIYSTTSASYHPSFRLLAGYAGGGGRSAPRDPDFIHKALNAAELCWQLRDGDYLDRPGDRAISVVTLPVNDSDLDGMDDGWEETMGLSVGVDDAALDPDDDGESNLREYEKQTNPQSSDTDGDGLNDRVETNTGAYLNDDDRGTSPLMADTDGDGLTDNLENPSEAYVRGSRPGSDPNLRDTDGDTIHDGEEMSWLTDPTLVDSDGDGISDHWELAHYSDPNDRLDPVRIPLVPHGEEATKQWPSPRVLPTFDAYEADLDQSDVTFVAAIDFEEKLSGEREVIFEAGGALTGFSLVYESGNRLVLRAMGLELGQLLHAKIERVLSESEVSGGEIELMWGYDVANEWGTQTIGLWINGRVASEVDEDLGGDWSGSNDAGFGVLAKDESSLTGAGDSGDLAGTDFVSGTINRQGGLRMFAERYPELEAISLRDDKLKITDIRLGQDLQTTLTWDSQPNRFYRLESSQDLINWLPISGKLFSNSNRFEAIMDAEVSGQGFYRVRETYPLHADFEHGLGEWSSETWTGDTVWEIGPTSESSHQHIVGTNLYGEFTPNVVASLRSPLVDLTQVTWNPIISFRYRIDTTQDVEGGQLRYLSEAGDVLFTHPAAFSGKTEGWETFRHPLPQEVQGSRFVVEFLFQSDGDDIVGEGWYLDDVLIR